MINEKTLIKLLVIAISMEKGQIRFDNRYDRGLITFRTLFSVAMRIRERVIL